VTPRGHKPPPLSALEVAVAARHLSGWGGTRVERLFKDLRESATDRSRLDRVLHELGVPPGEAAARIEQAVAAARRALARARALDLSILDDSHPDYPEQVRQIPDPPIVLWVKGDPRCLSEAQVAIVGSRAATPAALSVSRQLGRDLTEAGLVITSGLARGVDAAAHAGALDAGGRTVAVLGCGVDVAYPREHGPLARRIAHDGAVVAELPPGARPLPHHFPLRNRIISGLVRAVVVIEANERSGSLITARAALDQGRDVLAVPGGVLSGRSRGCHALIRDGARLVESAADVLDELGWPAPVAREPDRTKPLQSNALEETMAAGESYTLDDLVAETGRPAQDLLADLGELELGGRITRVAGGAFTKT